MNSDRFDRLLISFTAFFIAFVLAYLLWQLFIR